MTVGNCGGIVIEVLAHSMGKYKQLTEEFRWCQVSIYIHKNCILDSVRYCAT